MGDHNSEGKGTVANTLPSSHHLSLLIPFNFFTLVSHRFHSVLGATELLKQNITNWIFKKKEENLDFSVFCQ